MDEPKNRINNLKNRINNYENEQKSNNFSKKKGAGFGFRVSTEIVAALVVGVVIGIIVDNYFNTEPFGLIIFFILGALAGFLNIYRVMRRNEKE